MSCNTGVAHGSLGLNTRTKFQHLLINLNPIYRKKFDPFPKKIQSRPPPPKKIFNSSGGLSAP